MMSPYSRSLLLNLNEKQGMVAKVFIRIMGYGAKRKVRQDCGVHGKRRRP